MTDILINAQPGETRMALIEDGRLAEVEVARTGARSAVGDIYLGRVDGVRAALDAAFIDIGLERSGFLALPEARPHGEDGGNDGIGDYVSEGESVLVQVQRDAFQDKGAKLTTHITLPGAVLVMAPGRPGVGVSKRIAGEETRRRLRNRIQELAGDGFIARTAAAGASDDAIGRDLAALADIWSEIVSQREAAKAPARLHGELDPVLRRLRDGALAHRIVIDCPDTLARARAFADRQRPDLADRLHPHSGKAPLFEAEGIEEQIDAALDPLVALPGGGAIIIEETRALTAIDVDTGPGGSRGGCDDAILVTNIEAADEIARQVRLRNLAGLLVVDFVSMRRRPHRYRVLDALRRSLAPDPSDPQVIGFTTLGLVEMTRRRGRPSLAQVLCGRNSGGRRKSALTVAFDVLRAVGREARARPGGALCVTAAADVIQALQGAAGDALAAAEVRLGRPLALIADPSCRREGFHVGASDG
jgi:ribonuclease G